MAMRTVSFHRRVCLNYLKRIYANKLAEILLFSAFFIILSTSSTFAGGTTLSLSEGGTHNIGESFNVDVLLRTGGTKLCAVKAYLSFPANLLEVVSITPGPIYTMEAVKKYSNQAGTISYTLAPSGSCTSTDTTVYRVVFKAKSSGSGEIKFSSAETGTGDSNGMPQMVMVGLNNTSFTVNGTSSNENTNTNLPPAQENKNQNKNSNYSPSGRIVTTSNVGAALVNDNGLVTPTLKTVEFDPKAEFDKAGKRSKGVNFYGTANPNVKVNISLGKNINFSAASDENGNWKAYYSDWLIDGVHILTAQSEKDGKLSSQLITPFTLSSQRGEIATGSKLPGAFTSQSGNQVENKLTGKTLGIIIISFSVLLLIVLAILYYWLKKKEENKPQNDKKLINNNINNTKGGA